MEQEPEQIKMLVAIPTSGMVCAGFMSSVVGLFSFLTARALPSRPGAKIDLGLMHCESSVIHSNREKLAKAALEGGFTHLLFLDDDMIFAPGIIDFLFSRRAPIVVVNYLIKSENPRFVAIGLDGSPLPTLPTSTGTEPILYSGFGFSLFETRVFAAMPQPWFQPQWVPHLREYTTEDNPCYAKMREAGFTVLLDHDASKLVGHVGRATWTVEAYKPPVRPVPDPALCAVNGQEPPRSAA